MMNRLELVQVGTRVPNSCLLSFEAIETTAAQQMASEKTRHSWRTKKSSPGAGSLLD